jgi:hypothetical protein
MRPKSQVSASLWEIMNRFTASNCCELFAAWGQFQQLASSDDPSRELPHDAQEMAGVFLLSASNLCRDLDLPDSLEAAEAVRVELAKGMSCGEILWRLETLRESIERQMKRQLYYGIPEPLAKYVEKERPLGDDVYEKFPSARTDLSEAGNCLAFGCNTAAAFHLMRAAEIGLWELGKDRQILLATSGKIEFSEWGVIIGQLEEAVHAIQNWANTVMKEDAHKFYNTALVEIRAFNDGWRRHIMHVRPYQPRMGDDEALALWGHVSRFLSTLAGKIGEGKYTSLVW